MQATMIAVFQVLGCSTHAPKAMVEDQGMYSLDELCFLKEGDVETMSKNVKCPGGAAEGNHRSANLGHLIGQKAEMIIKPSAYYMQYFEKSS